MVEKLIKHPKKIFLIDGIAALLSAFLLGFVFVKFERIFGIPAKALYFLATMPVIFAIFDLFCYTKNNAALGRFMVIIAVLNLIYCCTSTVVAFYHFNTITIFGWSYLLIEILIIILFSIVELIVAKRLNKPSE